MAGKTAVLNIRIVSDASKAGAGFADAEKKAGRFSGGMEKAGKVAAGAGLAIAGLAIASFKAASDLEQSTGAIESVFGDAGDAVKGFAKDAADSLGLSQNSYQELAAVLGAQLKNMGIAADQLAPKTDELIRLGADLAATYGGTTAEAVQALSSLLKGEADPIERYGIAIKASTIEAYLASKGLDDLEGAAAEAAKSEALLALAFQQAAPAIGAGARESGTAASQLQQLQAHADNATAALGTALLPIVAAGAEKLAVFATFVAENSAVIVPLVAALTVLVAVIWLVNLAMAANPIVLLVAGIAAAIVVVILLMAKFEGFRNFMVGAFMAITIVPRTLIGLIQTVVEKLGGWSSIFATIKSVGVAAFNALMAPLRWLAEKIAWVVDKVGWIKSAGGFVAGLFSAPSAMPGGQTAAAGMFGAAEGAGAPQIRGASLSSLAGGTSPSAGQGPASIIVTINGALDPVAVGRQLDGILRKYGQVSGRQVSAAMAR